MSRSELDATHVYYNALDDVVYLDFGILAGNTEQWFARCLLPGPRAGVIPSFFLRGDV
jgi:hypothetical protein